VWRAQSTVGCGLGIARPPAIGGLGGNPSTACERDRGRQHGECDSAVNHRRRSAHGLGLDVKRDYVSRDRTVALAARRGVTRTKWASVATSTSISPTYGSLNAPLPYKLPHVLALSESVEMLELEPPLVIVEIGQRDVDRANDRAWPDDLDRANAEHVRQVLEWLAGATSKSA
jgi:hypothetical protein